MLEKRIEHTSQALDVPIILITSNNVTAIGWVMDRRKEFAGW